MKKFLGIVVLIAVIVFAGWAYMNSGTPANPKPESTATPDVTVKPETEITPDTTATPEPEETVTPAPTSAPKNQKLSAKAIYGGREDSNFIEIKMDGKFISAMLSPELNAGFDNLNIKEGDSVTIEYTLEKGIYTVYKISKN